MTLFSISGSIIESVAVCFAMAESKLTEALAELQAQHQEQICICKERIRKTLSSKVIKPY